MSKNDFEKLKSLVIPRLEANKRDLENLPTLRLQEQANKDKTKQQLIDHNKGILSSCGVTELFEKIKIEQLLGDDTVVENNEDCTHLYLNWNYVHQESEDDRTGEKIGGYSCKKVVAVVENNSVFIGFSIGGPSNIRMKRVIWGNLANLVSDAISNAVSTAESTPLHKYN
jgi:hypothetical protein